MKHSQSEFIDQLLVDQSSIRASSSSLSRLIVWGLFSSIFLFLLYKFLWGFRPRFYSEFSDLFFLAESMLPFLASFWALSFAFKLGTPGRAAPPPLLAISAVLMFFYILFQAINYLQPSGVYTMAGKRPMCHVEIMVYSTALWGVFIFLMRTAAPVKKRTQSFLIGFSCASLNVGMMQISCMYEPLHILKLHVGPLIVFTLITTLIGEKFLRWDKKSPNFLGSK